MPEAGKGFDAGQDRRKGHDRPGAHYSHDHHNECRGHRTPDSESQCRPHQGWKQHVLAAVNQAGRRLRSSEDEQSDGNSEGADTECLDDPLLLQLDATPSRPQKEHRRHHQISDRVADPPCPPCFQALAGFDERESRKHGDSHGGADQCAAH